MHELDCDCGNEKCHNQLMFRRAPIWDAHGKKIAGWLHVDVTDMEGKWIEFMITEQEAKWLMWWFIKNYSFKRLRWLRTKFNYYWHHTPSLHN